MECPNCGYEPTLSELQRSSDDCVKCGINYAGYKAALESRASEERAWRSELASMSTVVRDAVGDYRGAQPVVVIDVRMSFWSMVKFMVKWALAAIPAAVILFVMFFVLTSFFGGLLQGISRYF